MAWFVWMLFLALTCVPFFVYVVYVMIETMIATPTFNVIATYSLLLTFMVFAAVCMVVLFVENYKQIKSDKK